MAKEERSTFESNIAGEQPEAPIESATSGGVDEESQAISPEADREEARQRLEDARNKADQHWNDLLRARAELENQRRRHERELEKARKYALERFAQELLPVKDSLEMGLSAAQDEHADVGTLREGMELILKIFNEATAQFGIEVVDPQGDPFNPDFHQAVSMQESDETPPSTVLTVVRKGYKLNDRLLRPAMVIVSKPGSREEISPEADPET